MKRLSKKMLPFKDQRSANAARSKLGELGRKIRIDIRPVYTSRKIRHEIKPKESAERNRQSLTNGLEMMSSISLLVRIWKMQFRMNFTSDVFSSKTSVPI